MISVKAEKKPLTPARQGPRILIAPDERDALAILATYRTWGIRHGRATPGKGREDMLYQNRLSPYQTDLHGVQTEWMVARYLGGYLNTRIYPGGDRHRPDVETIIGAIEVKSARRGLSFALRSLNRAEFQAEYGVLVYAVPLVGEGELHGYITQSEFNGAAESVNLLGKEGQSRLAVQPTGFDLGENSRFKNPIDFHPVEELREQVAHALGLEGAPTIDQILARRARERLFRDVLALVEKNQWI